VSIGSKVTLTILSASYRIARSNSTTLGNPSARTGIKSVWESPISKDLPKNGTRVYTLTLVKRVPVEKVFLSIRKMSFPRGKVFGNGCCQVLVDTPTGVAHLRSGMI